MSKKVTRAQVTREEVDYLFEIAGLDRSNPTDVNIFLGVMAKLGDGATTIEDLAATITKAAATAERKPNPQVTGADCQRDPTNNLPMFERSKQS